MDAREERAGRLARYTAARMVVHRADDLGRTFPPEVLELARRVLRDEPDPWAQKPIGKPA